MNPVKVKRQDKPFRHYLVTSSKQVHGWFDWNKRECTQERFLLNPYNGCCQGCFYCYTRAFPGYFNKFHNRGDIFVFKDFDKKVAAQLDKLNIGFCGYLSPVTEPFQKIDQVYRLSERLVEVFIQRNLPIEFITKQKIPQRVIELLPEQEHSFAQVSILSLDIQLSALLSGGTHPGVLLNNLERLKERGIFSVCRIDPVMPFINDRKEDLTAILIEAKKRGVRHIISSVLDIPPRLKNYILLRIKQEFGTQTVQRYESLYRDNIGYLHADINYRKEIFGFLKKKTRELGMTFALCMEYEYKSGQLRGLNADFASSPSCEGINIPIYKRAGSRFYPVKGCSGNCLLCDEPVCGIEELAYKKTKRPLALKYSDYRRYSKTVTAAVLGD
jgi:DNA repair photolyase